MYLLLINHEGHMRHMYGDHISSKVNALVVLENTFERDSSTEIQAISYPAKFPWMISEIYH